MRKLSGGKKTIKRNHKTIANNKATSPNKKINTSKTINEKL
jgi:hypothetical protein